MTCYFFRNLAVIWYLSLIDIFSHSAIFFGFQRLSKFTSFGFLSPGHTSFLQFPSEFFLTFRIPYGLFSMRVFKNLSFPFKHTSNTLFLLMSLCRFKKTGLHRTTYLKWITHLPPKAPEAALLLRSDVKTAPSLSVPWASENDWSFKSLQLKGSELSRSMKQVHQVPINTYDGGQTVVLRQQKSSTMWVCGTCVSHAMAKRPVNITWKCTACSYTTCFSSLWLLSIFWKWKRRQWALHDLAFPDSWGKHGSHWRFAICQTQSALSTHCINAHIGSPLH